MNNTKYAIVPGNTIQEKEDFILKNYDLLKLEKFTLKEEILEIFIKNFIYYYNITYYTYNDRTKGNGCLPGKHRSLLDIFLICKFYFPECTLKEVKDILLNIEEIVNPVCLDIGRRIYDLRERCSWESGGYSGARPEIKDEFGYDKNELKKA